MTEVTIGDGIHKLPICRAGQVTGTIRLHWPPHHEEFPGLHYFRHYLAPRRQQPWALGLHRATNHSRILAGAEIETAHETHIKTTLLKQDTFGSVRLEQAAGTTLVVRDTRSAPWWARWLARRLAAREARALRAVHDVVGVPTLQAFDGKVLQRQWLAGEPMYIARPTHPDFYRQALRIVIQLHRRGVAHNDLAKEPNWLVLEDGTPGLVDFQLASYHGQRGRWFRTLAREDLRHLLKHKRYYLPEGLTQRQRSILETPGWPSRTWGRWGKPIYLFVTRRLFGWADREGAEDRGRPGAV